MKRVMPMPKNPLHFMAVFLIALLVGVSAEGILRSQNVAAQQSADTSALRKDDAGRNLLPPQWWEKATAACTIRLRRRIELDPPLPTTNTWWFTASLWPKEPFPIKNAARTSEELDRIKALGYSAIDIGSNVDQPSETSGRVWPGLETKDHYALSSQIDGTMEDFRRLVRLAHSKGLAVTIFYNLGYCSLDAPFFLKACDDMREGRTNTKEARWFLWSDRVDAPPPRGDTVFMFADPIRNWLYMHSPNEPGPTPRWLSLRGILPGMWVYCKRAGGKYYWSKWGGVNGLDDQGNQAQLPHYDWQNQEWQEEAEKILRFWMDTGLDGISMDAPPWYVNCGWEVTRRRITGVLASYGNTFRQPEGGGNHGEDPGVWISEGGYNSVREYRLPAAVRTAIQTGDPRPIEAALISYHDRFVDAGGVLACYSYNTGGSGADPAGHLASATQVLLGELLVCDRARVEQDPGLQRLLKLKGAHPALQNLSKRRKLPSTSDDKHYAFLRTAADGSERIVVVINFQSTQQTVDVDLSGVSTAGLVDLETRTESPRQWSFKVNLPAYGYRLFQLKPANVGRQGK